jgi:hypothetical protein
MPAVFCHTTHRHRQQLHAPRVRRHALPAVRVRKAQVHHALRVLSPHAAQRSPREEEVEDDATQRQPLTRHACACGCACAAHAAGRCALRACRYVSTGNEACSERSGSDSERAALNARSPATTSGVAPRRVRLLPPQLVPMPTKPPRRALPRSCAPRVTPRGAAGGASGVVDACIAAAARSLWQVARVALRAAMRTSRGGVCAATMRPR